MNEKIKQHLADLRDGTSREKMSGASFQLARLGEESVQPLLGILLESEENEGFRARVVETLAKIGTSTCVSGLMTAVRDDSVLVRWSAVMALGEMRCIEAIPLLKECLDDPGTKLVSNSYHAQLQVAESGQVEARPVSVSVSVKHAARRALSMIEGENQDAAGADSARRTQSYLDDLAVASVVEHEEAQSLALNRATPDGKVASIIDASRGLNATPFYLRKGKMYRFSVKGEWGSGHRSVSAAGYASTALLKPFERFRRLPRANWLALIGRIGKGGRLQFNIPENGTIYTAGEDGVLYCFANGLPFTNFTNRGSIELRVMQLDVPDPDAVAQRHGFEQMW